MKPSNHKPSNHKLKPSIGFDSTCVHGGHLSDPNYAHITPIYATSTFVFDSAEQGAHRFSGKEEGYIYSRFGNPSSAEAERKIAALETYGIQDEQGEPLAAKALLHASGMAALTTLFLSHLKSGEKILTHPSLYGGTNGLLQDILPDLGIEAIVTDMHDLNQIENLLKEDQTIRLVFMETPANPTLRCIDIEKITLLAHQYDRLTAIDNTFATPYLQQPFRYGIDYVFHSTTKYLNGHGSAIGGVLIGRNIEKMQSVVKKTYSTLGGNSNPFDAYLLTQGMKTLALRMEKHCENAKQVAHFLTNHPAVLKVNYPGNPQHPDFDIAQKQMKKPGAMLSFELKDGFQAGKRLINQLQFCTKAVSLGTCDTLLCHPASMTHANVSKIQREKGGISDGLVRMSVGIENVEDIIADLQQAI